MKKRSLVQLVVSVVAGFLFVSCKTSKALTAPDPGTAIQKSQIALSASTSLASDPDRLSPVISSAQYTRLQQALRIYAAIPDKQWDVIPYPKASFKQGHSSPVIKAVKTKLRLLGDFNSSDTSSLFTPALETAVRSFQNRF